jgi:hypothetical protein
MGGVRKGPFEGAEQMWSVCLDGDRVLAGSKPAYLYESLDRRRDLGAA